LWQLFLIVTAPVYQLSRALTWNRLPERWDWLVSLVWLLMARYVVARLHSSGAP
jgi:hypothetical protein